MSIPGSQFIPLQCPLLASTYLFSTSVSLYFSFTNKIIYYHVTQLHVYMLMYDLCFSLLAYFHSPCDDFSGPFLTFLKIAVIRKS